MKGVIRRNLFWLSDYAKNEGRIKKQYDEISYYLLHESNNSAYRNSNNEVVNRMLLYASEHTAFYKQWKGNKLEEFPVINKSVCIDNYSDFQSVEFIDKPLHTMRTNGSTGKPFKMVQDYNKRSRVIAELKGYMRLAGLYPHESMYYWDVLSLLERKKRWWDCWKENIWWFDVFHFQREDVEEMIEFMMRHPSKLLFTFPSAIKCFGEMVDTDERLLNLKIQTIVLVGEALSFEVKMIAKRLFGSQCKILSRYGNQEMGVLGQQIKENGEFILNFASYFFEFLKLDSDMPATDGEIARIVITDLYNKAFPLIRYDTGDLAIVERNNEKNIITCKDIIGKANDVLYDCGGYPILSDAIDELFWNYTQINQWQIRQESLRRYMIFLKMVPGSDDVSNELYKYLKELLGEDAEISISSVPEIPDVGYKKRYIICEVPEEERRKAAKK